MKILLVDDSQPTRCLLKAMLQPYGEVIEAVDGKEAVDLVVENLEEPFDLIFLDIVMPRMDGHEALRQIRELEDNHNFGPTPTVIISALSDAADVVQSCVVGGAEFYLVKPATRVDIAELMRRLNEVKSRANREGCN